MTMINKLFTVAMILLVTAFAVALSSPSNMRPRVSDLGLKVGVLPAGPLDAITDVAGVEVGTQFDPFQAEPQASARRAGRFGSTTLDPAAPDRYRWS